MIHPNVMIPSFRLLKPHIKAGHDLIPLREYEKIPRDKYWRDNDYSKTSFWTHMKVRGNVGVRLGAEQLVLDIDPKNFPIVLGKPQNSLAMLERDLGINWDMMPRVRTGSGGWHIYMLKPKNHKIIGKLNAYPGIEFKTQGSQVVAAGSVHPVTKQLYKVEIDPIFGDLLQAVEAPSSLLKLIARQEKEVFADGGIHTPEQLRVMLSGLNPMDYREHDKWLRIMMACHHATGGEGVWEFMDWSTSDPDYCDAQLEIEYRWQSLRSNFEKGVTYRMLYKVLHAAGKGALIPVEDAKFDAVSDEDIESLKMMGA